MKPISALRWPASRQRRIGMAAVVLAIAAVATYAVMARSDHPQTASKETVSDEKTEPGVVHLPEARWTACGVRVEPAGYAPLTERVWRSGHLTLDESRIAHLSPTVEGMVREVKVRLGQDVKAGDVLAVLDAREVGQAKLDLVKARLATKYAQAHHDWTQSTGLAAADLVEAMNKDVSVSDIDSQFKNRAIGDLRQQLVTAYSRRRQAKTHYDAVSLPDAQGSVPQSSLVRMKADYEAAEAAFRALCEEARFQTGQQIRASEQKLREAQTAEALARSALMMLGYSREEVDTMDPIAEGNAVSYYPIRAPFGGTVIEQHAVLAERVGPAIQMFKIADLAKLWLRADVPQKDVPLIRNLSGATVRFKIVGGGHAVWNAEVFYTGDVVDANTRTVTLTATVPNPDRALKSGTFVEVELTHPGAAAVQVPLAAVQREGTQPFVFVHLGGGRFRRVDVGLGRTSAGIVEITQGLQSGQPVAIAGGFVLKSELFKDKMAGD